MKILAIEQARPGATAEAFIPHLKAEAARAWEFYQAGILREIYFRQDRPDAVLMLECRDVDEANEILSSLPLVKAGLIAFDLIPLCPYPGFARLFAEELTFQENES
jgi:muconolactone delta-isomerase